MKRKFFSVFAFMFLSMSSFAFGGNEIEVDIQNESLDTQNESFDNLASLTYPSGSYTYTDSCGDTYEISWYCTNECSLSHVISALTAWEEQNTCGSGSSSDFESTGW